MRKLKQNKNKNNHRLYVILKGVMAKNEKEALTLEDKGLVFMINQGGKNLITLRRMVSKKMGF